MDKTKTCVLILENLRSVENVASIFRTADGLGVSRIILVGTTPTPLDRFGRKRKDFAKISLGAEKTVNWEYIMVKNLRLRIQDLKGQSFQIISLEQDSRSYGLKDFKAQEKFALIVGSEVEGVSKASLNNSDAIVEILMQGSKESLNVSVATGTALYVLLSSHA